MGWLKRIFGKATPARENTSRLVNLGDRISGTVFAFAMKAGPAALFNPATLVGLTKTDQVFISQSSPDKLPAEMQVYVFIKDLPAIEECKALMGDGSDRHAIVLASGLIGRSVLALLA
jgi:hypothetical protein